MEPQEAKEAETLSCSVEPAGRDRSETCSLVFSLETEAETEAESEATPPTAPKASEPVSKPVEPLLVNIEPQSVPEKNKANDQTQLDLTKGQKMTEVLLDTSSHTILPFSYFNKPNQPCPDEADMEQILLWYQVLASWYNLVFLNLYVKRRFGLAVH